MNLILLDIINLYYIISLLVLKSLNIMNFNSSDSPCPALLFFNSLAVLKRPIKNNLRISVHKRLIKVRI